LISDLFAVYVGVTPGSVVFSGARREGSERPIFPTNLPVFGPPPEKAQKGQYIVEFPRWVDKPLFPWRSLVIRGQFGVVLDFNQSLIKGGFGPPGTPSNPLQKGPFFGFFRVFSDFWALFPLGLTNGTELGQKP